MSYSSKSIYHLIPAILTPQITQGLKSIEKNWLARHERDSSLILYHYTSFEGLSGILANRAIWCSHISSFNDPLEFQYGKSLVVQELKSISNNTHEHEIDSFLEWLIDHMEVFEYIYNAYIACFCESDNLLSQWRGYGASGGGYNVGVAFESDTKFSHDIENIDDNDEENHVILRKIIYNQKEQKILIKKVVQVLVESASKGLAEFKKQDNLPEAWPQMASMQAINILYDIVLSLKHPAFEEEAEWRLIKTIQEGYKPQLFNFQERKGRLTSYLNTYIFTQEEDYLQFPVESIRFGPTLDEKITRQSLNLLVNKLTAEASIIKINATNISIESSGYNLRP